MPDRAFKLRAARCSPWAVAVLALIQPIVDSGRAHASDALQGRQRVAGTCQACHGMDGLSKNPEAPNLAGQLESYLARTLVAYRSGERRNETMNIVAKDLSDDDIAATSAYYSSIQVDVGLPP